MRPQRRPLALVFLVAATAPATAQSPADAQQRVTLAVIPFELAAPSGVVHHRPAIWPPMRPAMRPPLGVPSRSRGPSPPIDEPVADDDTERADPIGVGIADLIVARLLETPGFRVVEGRRLDLLRTEQPLVARYIVTGSVTRFGTEERRGLGGIGGALGLGGLGLKRPKTEVTLVARIVDATTGEIVASMTGTGTSSKGGSIIVGAGGGGVGGGVAITSSEFRASALGEATGRAITQLVDGIVAKRGAMRPGD